MEYRYITGRRLLYRLVGILATLKQNEILGSKVFFNNGARILSHGGVWNSKTGSLSCNGYGEMDSDKYGEEFAADWTGGMGTLFPVQLIKDIGLFDDKNFPQYFGDSDFFLRAREKGYLITVSPKLIVRNDETHTGLSHNLGLKTYLLSLYSMQSLHNVMIRGKFYKRHLSSRKGWSTFAYTVCEYSARFFRDYTKAKILSFRGASKKS